MDRAASIVPTVPFLRGHNVNMTTPRGAVAIGMLCLALAACAPAEVRNTEMSDTMNGVMVDALGNTLQTASATLATIYTGMSGKAVLQVFGQGPLPISQPTDSMRVVNGFRRKALIANGVIYTVVFYRTKPGTIDEAVVRDTEFPVVLVSDTVVAKGWTAFDKMSKDVGLPDHIDWR